jgi:hypothetical protein
MARIVKKDLAHALHVVARHTTSSVAVDDVSNIVWPWRLSLPEPEAARILKHLEAIASAARVKRGAPAQVTFAHYRLYGRQVRRMPVRLGDKAYHSDKRDAQWAERGIETVCCNRIDRMNQTQDGRLLRC